MPTSAATSFASAIARARAATPAARSVPVLRISDRASGASGSPSAPSSMHWPVSTVNLAWDARSAISLTKRVLPPRPPRR